MTILRSGFPLKSLVALAKPQASAKFLRFETAETKAVQDFASIEKDVFRSRKTV